MAINLKSERADRLARELAELTGESITDAVVAAIDERLVRERSRDERARARRRAEMERIAAHFQSLPVLDSRTPDEIIGYDEFGLPS